MPEHAPSLNDQPAEAWLAVFEAHEQAAVRYAWSLTGNAESAEELIQTTLVELVSRAVPCPEHAKPYLLRCLRNRAALNARSRDAASRAMHGRLGGFANACVSTSEPRSEDARLLLEQLSPDEREVVVLHLRSGLTFAEIARVLEQPIGTVSSRYTRTLQRLRRASHAASAV